MTTVADSAGDPTYPVSAPAMVTLAQCCVAATLCKNPERKRCVSRAGDDAEDDRHDPS